MITREMIEQTTKLCLEKLDFSTDLRSTYFASLPIVVIDCIFSIGVKYESVTNTLKRVSQKYEMPIHLENKYEMPNLKEQISVSDFLKKMKAHTPEELAEQVFGNRQRTSTRNGILKSQAVVEFLEVLKNCGVDYFQDIKNLFEDSKRINQFEKAFKSIKGQNSGVSLKYFYMQTGNEDYIKPDRMIIRFLRTATKSKLNHDDCKDLLGKVAKELAQHQIFITPAKLDNKIWQYQRTIKELNN